MLVLRGGRERPAKVCHIVAYMRPGLSRRIGSNACLIPRVIRSTAGPSGWNTIGSTGLSFFDPECSPAALLRPGDRIRFNPVEVKA